MKHILTVCALAGLLAIPSVAPAYEPLAATIKVSGGRTYDYVIVGESPKATDGFDNAYDTLAPGGSLNATYISAHIDHPEWGEVKNQFRGDIRSMAKTQTWTITVDHTLAAGTQMIIAIDPLMSILPATADLSIYDPATGTTTNLKSGYTFAATTGSRTFTVTATQPDTPPPTATNQQLPGPAGSGDLDGDGRVTIRDAFIVLRMAVGMTVSTPEAIAAGDVATLLLGSSRTDGKLTIQDAILIMRMALGLPS